MKSNVRHIVFLLMFVPSSYIHIVRNTLKEAAILQVEFSSKLSETDELTHNPGDGDFFTSITNIIGSDQ